MYWSWIQGFWPGWQKPECREQRVPDICTLEEECKETSSSRSKASTFSQCFPPSIAKSNVYCLFICASVCIRSKLTLNRWLPKLVRNSHWLQTYNPPASAFPSAGIQVSPPCQAKAILLFLIYALNIYLCIVCWLVYMYTWSQRATYGSFHQEFPGIVLGSSSLAISSQAKKCGRGVNCGTCSDTTAPTVGIFSLCLVGERRLQGWRLVGFGCMLWYSQRTNKIFFKGLTISILSHWAVSPVHDTFLISHYECTYCPFGSWLYSRCLKGLLTFPPSLFFHFNENNLSTVPGPMSPWRIFVLFRMEFTPSLWGASAQLFLSRLPMSLSQCKSPSALLRQTRSFFLMFQFLVGHLWLDGFIQGFPNRTDDCFVFGTGPWSPTP